MTNSLPFLLACFRLALSPTLRGVLALVGGKFMQVHRDLLWGSLCGGRGCGWSVGRDFPVPLSKKETE